MNKLLHYLARYAPQIIERIIKTLKGG